MNAAHVAKHFRHNGNIMSMKNTVSDLRRVRRDAVKKENFPMLVELSIIPVGNNPHTSAELAKALQLVDASGLLYRLTPSGTCIEGEWDTVMPLIRQCHERVRKSVPHIITMIKIED